MWRRETPPQTGHCAPAGVDLGLMDEIVVLGGLPFAWVERIFGDDIGVGVTTRPPDTDEYPDWISADDMHIRWRALWPFQKKFIEGMRRHHALPSSLASEQIFAPMFGFGAV